MFPVNDNVPLILEGKTQDGTRWVIPIDRSPFVIGRKEGANLFLGVEGVSRKHAVISESTDGWRIMDCCSTNGTYVNGTRLCKGHLLKHGDSITIAELRFDVVEQYDVENNTIIINPYTVHFEKMLEQRAILSYFQPLVSFCDQTVIGYEMLGRGAFPDLPVGPLELFHIARRLGKQVELSELFREEGLKSAALNHDGKLILFNTLPEEMDLDKLCRTLGRIRNSHPKLRLGMELHENTVTDVEMMKRLRRILDDIDILLVYDDFGSGQSRLSELLDVSPDLMKFDISLIRDIDKRTPASRSVVGTLVRMAKDSGIGTVAEGIETIEEADVCKHLGFDLAQGFYFGRPAPF